MINGRNGGCYDFKSVGIPDNLNSGEQVLYYYRGMPINFGNENYITTARDIGNVFAGFIAGINGLPYRYARFGFDFYQKGPEPNVSRYAQDYGFLLGKNIYNNAIKNFFKKYWPW